MEVKWCSVAASFAIAVAITWALRILNFVWWRPKQLERCLREQGLNGNPYRFWHGDLNDIAGMNDQELSKPISLEDDVLPHLLPFNHHIVRKYGKKSFIWNGPIPRVNIMEPDMIRDVLFKYNIFQKPISNPVTRLLVSGLVSHEGDEWSRHRRILNPVFTLEKLKNMLPAMHLSCIETMKKWNELLGEKSYGEVDVFPGLSSLSADVISRTAFGSSYEEGKRIFELQTEQARLTFQLLQSIYIPGWRFLPTKTNRRMKENHQEVCTLMRGIINRREKALRAGEIKNNDLLGILMESNIKEIHEHGNKKGVGITIDEVIDECKLFYFAGQETTGNLLTWTMVMLAKHVKWQEFARQEVLQAFGGDEPNFEVVNRLKIVNMVLNEVLRMYPPGTQLVRITREKIKLGDLTLPPGVELTLPILQVHYDTEIWGNDANEFKPDRFSEGVANAAKSPAAFFPFSSGPRICIGMNFAMIEAKLALAMILKNFSFELAPSYTHAPFPILTLRPQYSVNMILHKI